MSRVLPDGSPPPVLLLSLLMDAVLDGVGDGWLSSSEDVVDVISFKQLSLFCFCMIRGIENGFECASNFYTVLVQDGKILR